MSKEEELGIGKDRRKVDMNEEYYRLAAKVSDRFGDEVGIGDCGDSWLMCMFVCVFRIWIIGRIRG